MNLSSGKNTQILLLVALVAALLFAVYYYVVLPKQREEDALHRSIQTLNSEISTIQTSINQLEAENAQHSTNIYSLEKKVPRTQEIDELLLNIEEIEYVSNSYVTSISFSEGTPVADAGIGIQTEEAVNPDQNATTNQNASTNQNATTDPNTNAQGTEDQTADENVEPTFMIDLPPELKMLSFTLEITSPDYNHLLQFINEIESLERIMHIDTISYSLPGEQAVIDENVSPTVQASIQVTTFYYEGK